MYAKSKNKNESLKQVVSTVASAFDVIKKRSRSKDKNAASRAITTTLVNKSTSENRLISNISGYINVNHKTFKRVVKGRLTLNVIQQIFCGLLEVGSRDVI